MSNQITGAQSLVKSLEAAGVDVMFGLPGGAILPAYDPIYDSKIRHILVRHEQGAGHAAEGYAQVTGRAGVCIATSGPGATNLVTPLADAAMDSVPVVAITGQVPGPAIGTDAFQEADIRGITMPFTKHNFLVTDAREIPNAVAQAFHIATTGRPGPVLVDIAKEAIDQIQYGLKSRYTINDYKMEIYADTIVEAALNKFLNELNSSEKYLEKMPETFPTNNIIYDLFEKFGEVYEGYLDYVYDDIVLDEPELEALRNMKREPEGLWLYIIRAFLEKYPQDRAFQKFKELYKRDFVFPRTYQGVEGTAELPEMRLFNMLDPKETGQMSFQDLPEGQSFNFARYKAKMMKF